MSQPGAAMKIVKLRSMGGSGKTTMQRTLDAEPAANRMTGKRRVKARVVGITRGLAPRLDEISSALSIALLEFALERYLAIYGDPDDAYDAIQADLHHALRKRRSTLR
jgi:hypothetical protein